DEFGGRGQVLSDHEPPGRVVWFAKGIRHARRSRGRGRDPTPGVARATSLWLRVLQARPAKSPVLPPTRPRRSRAWRLPSPGKRPGRAPQALTRRSGRPQPVRRATDTVKDRWRQTTIAVLTP